MEWYLTLMILYRGTLKSCTYRHDMYIYSTLMLTYLVASWPVFSCAWVLTCPKAGSTSPSCFPHGPTMVYWHRIYQSLWGGDAQTCRRLLPWWHLCRSRLGGAPLSWLVPFVGMAAPDLARWMCSWRRMVLGCGGWVTMLQTKSLPLGAMTAMPEGDVSSEISSRSSGTSLVQGLMFLVKTSDLAWQISKDSI
jgi:hypothetical protein